MRATLIAMLVWAVFPFPALAAGSALDCPDDEPAVAEPIPPGAFPGADADPSAVPFEPEDEPTPRVVNPNAVTVRRPAFLHWWDDPIFDRRISLVLNGTDLDHAVDALGRAANMNLIAAGGSKARKKVSLNLRNAPLRDVMLALANLYDLTWFKSGEVYTLTYISASSKRAGIGPLPASRTRRPVIVTPAPRPPVRR